MTPSSTLQRMLTCSRAPDAPIIVCWKWFHVHDFTNSMSCLSGEQSGFLRIIDYVV